MGYRMQSTAWTAGGDHSSMLSGAEDEDREAKALGVASALLSFSAERDSPIIPWKRGSETSFP
jgi:hypothetical protein